jgi:hypothetical protein
MVSFDTGWRNIGYTEACRHWHLDTNMSAEDDPKRIPSAEEINAYLELSAARTKKRLPLALGSIGAPKRPGGDRKLPLTRAAKPLPVAADAGPGATGASPEAPPVKSKPSGD